MSDIHTYEPLWGSWYVESQIGEGSFGKVYKVRRDEFGMTYFSAVKIITIPQNDSDLRQMRSEGMDDASARSYFHAFVTDIIQEVNLMSEFRGNSNIVSFEDHKVIERTDGIGWDILIRMELLTSLTGYAADNPLDVGEVVKLGVHMCRALELCARKNTIHRDIKPDNIFVSQYSEYKLGDFGIARQIERTSSGLSKKGTYTYMAPEVFRGDDYGASVDTYSLGIVLYRLLNRNRSPFLPAYPNTIAPRDRDEALQRRMRGEKIPPIPGAPPKLNKVVLKACAYSRSDRFDTAGDMRRALEALQTARDTVPQPQAQPIRKPEPAPPDEPQTRTIFEPPEREPAPTVYSGGATDLFQFDSKGFMTIDAPIPPPYAAPKETKRKKRPIRAMIAICAAAAVCLISIALAISIRNLGYVTIRGTRYSKDIKRLALSDANLSDADIEPLRQMANLTFLSIGPSDISDLAPIEGLVNLQELWLGGNKISDIGPIAGLTNLEILYLESNAISNLRPLAKLVKLESLHLGMNKISDITPIKGLTDLRTLDLRDNKIADIAPLEQLTKLESLRMSSNNIVYISSISLLTNLRGLYLDGNMVSEIRSLEKLSNLMFLDLRDNPIADKHISYWWPVEHVANVLGRP
jgi:serine/threonine protein kinase